MLTAFVREILVTVTADPKFRVAHFTAGSRLCFHVYDLDRGGVDLPCDVPTALGTILAQGAQGYVVFVSIISGAVFFRACTAAFYGTGALMHGIIIAHQRRPRFKNVAVIFNVGNSFSLADLTFKFQRINSAAIRPSTSVPLTVCNDVRRTVNTFGSMLILVLNRCPRLVAVGVCGDRRGANVGCGLLRCEIRLGILIGKGDPADAVVAFKGIDDRICAAVYTETGIERTVCRLEVYVVALEIEAGESVDRVIRGHLNIQFGTVADVAPVGRNIYGHAFFHNIRFGIFFRSDIQLGTVFQFH